MDKTCDYCQGKGPAYTFMNGETICNGCLAMLGADSRELRRKLYNALTSLSAAEKERDTLQAQNADILAALQIVKEQRQLWWGKAVERAKFRDERDTALRERDTILGDVLQWLNDADERTRTYEETFYQFRDKLVASIHPKEGDNV